MTAARKPRKPQLPALAAALFRWLVIRAAVLAFTACATPDEVRRLEAESVASIEAYASNMRTATADLLAGYRGAERGRIAALGELDRRDATRTLDVPVLPEPLEDGHLDPAGVGTRRLEYLEPGEVDRLLAERAAAEERLLAVVEEYRAALLAAEADLDDALELRAKIREWLMRGGVEAEEIEALADGLARALREGR